MLLDLNHIQFLERLFKFDFISALARIYSWLIEERQFNGSMEHAELVSEKSVQLFFLQNVLACLLLISCLAYSSTLKMAIIRSSETSMSLYWTTQLHIGGTL
jgi:hypothetical protein